ncbi:MAG: AIR synthase-related protein [Candidatus Obscuribacterales bacterium]
MSRKASDRTIEQAVTDRDGAGDRDGSGITLLFLVLAPGADRHPAYWLDCPRETDLVKLEQALNEVLVDASYQEGRLSGGADLNELLASWKKEGHVYFAQKQFHPGVTDNLAHTVVEALVLTGMPRGAVRVASGSFYLFDGQEEQDIIFERSRYRLFHPLVETFEIAPLASAAAILPFPRVKLKRPAPPEEIDMELDDDGLLALSRDRLLALSLGEMRCVKEHFDDESRKRAREDIGLPDAPTDVELEIIAQTWSEHCKHKIFNAEIEYSEKLSTSGPDAPEHNRFVKSLYKTFIKGATARLKEERPDLLSVFEDNSGVVRWTDDWAVCFKVETHNSPSALEPFGGALTGILGVNRDILGTGLGARPIFNTDVFCFASPESQELAMRPKLLPPETIPRDVRHGVEDGGNKSGIPTVNGAVYFDDRYRGKPLVFCGTGGLLPIRRGNVDMIAKHTQKGDRIVVAGGRVGKDGIHGATFSSEALHEGSPVTAVQIGDPFTQKRLIDFVIEARDRGLLTGITDNGAGGLSSSVGEMANLTGGATIDLAKVPLKYPGLADWEIVVSESQERMTMSTDRPDELIDLASSFGVEAVDIGEFDDSGSFTVKRGNRVVASLSLDFLHDGNPVLSLRAAWQAPELSAAPGSEPGHEEALLALLGHENIASRERIIRQYDHEVQGRSVIKPLMGPDQKAPCDAAVIKPLYERPEGLVVSNGLAPQWSEYDPYSMAAFAVDEAVRNAVCAGADPDTISLLDNFCWPDPVQSAGNPDGSYKLGQLIRACQGLFDACLAFKTPLISGKDSMKNDFDDGQVRLSIPPTLLISAMGRIEDSEKALSSNLKVPGDLIYLLSCGSQSLTGSHYSMLYGKRDRQLATFDSKAAPLLYRKIHEAVRDELLHSAHDLSEGGLLVALAEKVLGSRVGAEIDLAPLLSQSGQDPDFVFFAEGPSRLLVSIPAASKDRFEKLGFTDAGIAIFELGRVIDEPVLKITTGDAGLEFPASSLLEAWMKPLPITGVDGRAL